MKWISTGLMMLDDQENRISCVCVISRNKNLWWNLSCLIQSMFFHFLMKVDVIIGMCVIYCSNEIKICFYSVLH